MSKWHKRPTVGRVHNARAGKAGDPSRGSNGKRLYANERWRSSRLRFLEQNPLCVLCAKRERVEPATVVDHVRPHRGDEQLFWDTGNWQALCKPCHDLKTASETRAVPMFPRVDKPVCEVVLVAGPPGAGKSRLVEERRKPGDLLIDLDQLLHDLTGRPLHSQASAMELRAALVERNRLLASLVDLPASRRVWFVTTAPRWSDRRRWQELLGCRLVLVEAPQDVCVKRCEGRPPGADWPGLVAEWFSCYTSGWDDELVRSC